jgi:hypothetical protein
MLPMKLAKPYIAFLDTTGQKTSLRVQEQPERETGTVTKSSNSKLYLGTSALAKDLQQCFQIVPGYSPFRLVQATSSQVACELLFGESHLPAHSGRPGRPAIDNRPPRMCDQSLFQGNLPFHWR